MTPDLDAAFAWYCDFLAAQGMDVPTSILDLSHTRVTILRTTAELQAQRRNMQPVPPRARTVIARPTVSPSWGNGWKTTAGGGE